MKLIFCLLITALFYSGCTHTQVQTQAPPKPAEQTREVASNSAYVENAYNTYFAKSANSDLIKKIEAVTRQLLSSMADKGNPKKKLVAKFLSDVQKEILITDVITEKSVIDSLARINASYKTMMRLGIYLSASGVFEKDSNAEDFYLSLLDRATAEIEKQLGGLVLVYPPEKKDADENNSRISYANLLANDVRNNLYKIYPINKNSNYKKIDHYFNSLAKVSDGDGAKRLLKTSDYLYVKNYMQNLQIADSGDIDGFQSTVDLTIATKFNFQMITELISTVR